MRLIFRLFETLSHAFVAFRRRIAESSVRAYLMQALRREEDAQAAFNAFLRAYDTRDGTRHAMHGVININDADALLRRMILTIDPNSIFPISQIVRVNGRALSLLVFLNKRDASDKIYVHYGLNDGTIYYWISPTRRFTATHSRSIPEYWRKSAIA